MPREADDGQQKLNKVIHYPLVKRSFIEVSCNFTFLDDEGVWGAEDCRVQQVMQDWIEEAIVLSLSDEMETGTGIRTEGMT